MNSFNEEIAKAVAETGAFEKEQAQKLITVPPDTEHGTFTLPCFVLARTLHKAPKPIAEELAPKIELPAGISKWRSPSRGFPRSWGQRHWSRRTGGFR